ncbi:MAG: hypothetical protein A2Z99_04395 [Treponema sp. GWB1_62_6]|nr:MAG: hypothetical protein A2Z99_04395 [Treponema sp. GWB1_62_6]
MTPAELCRKAAISIHDGKNRSCCRALLRYLAHESYIPASEMLVRMFRPCFIQSGVYWWELDDAEPRIFALLFCAEMLEEEAREGR